MLHSYKSWILNESDSSEVNFNEADFLKVYTDPKNAPKLNEINFKVFKEMIDYALSIKSNKLSNKELENFFKWICIDDIDLTILAIKKLLDKDPMIDRNQFYKVELKNMVFDHYLSKK